MGCCRCAHGMPAPPCGSTGYSRWTNKYGIPPNAASTQCQNSDLQTVLHSPPRVGQARKQVSLYCNPVALTWQGWKQTRLCPSYDHTSIQQMHHI